MPSYIRHTFVYTNSQSVTEVLETGRLLAENDSCEIRNWLKANHPLIVRRPCVIDDGNIVCCGLPLPPEMGKKRIGFELPAKCIVKTTLPPTLAESMVLLDEKKKDEVNRLLEELKLIGIIPRVVGSLAWQFLTGLNYLTEVSDIDLLFIVDNWEMLNLLDQVLEGWFQKQSGQYDIEIMSPDGEGFLWKEYRQKTATILLKRNRDVILAPREKVLL